MGGGGGGGGRERGTIVLENCPTSIKAASSILIHTDRDFRDAINNIGQTPEILKL